MVEVRALSAVSTFSITQLFTALVLKSFCVLLDTVSKIAIHLQSARWRQLLVSRVHRSTFATRAFSVAEPTVWNMLPDHLWNPAVDHEQFRRDLKIAIYLKEALAHQRRLCNLCKSTFTYSLNWCVRTWRTRSATRWTRYTLARRRTSSTAWGQRYRRRSRSCSVTWCKTSTMYWGQDQSSNSSRLTNDADQPNDVVQWCMHPCRLYLDAHPQHTQYCIPYTEMHSFIIISFDILGHVGSFTVLGVTRILSRSLGT